MRSETYMSKINLQRGKLTVENRKSREKKRICSQVSVNSPENPWSRSRRRNGRLWWEGFAEKESFKPRVKEWKGDGWWEWWVDRTNGGSATHTTGWGRIKLVHCHIVLCQTNTRIPLLYTLISLHLRVSAWHELQHDFISIEFNI